MLDSLIFFNFLAYFFCCTIYLSGSRGYNILLAREKNIHTFLFSSLFGSFSFFVSFCVQFTTFFSSTMQNNDEFNIDSTNAKPFSVLVILPH